MTKPERYKITVLYTHNTNPTRFYRQETSLFEELTKLVARRRTCLFRRFTPPVVAAKIDDGNNIVMVVDEICAVSIETISEENTDS